MVEHTWNLIETGRIYISHNSSMSPFANSQKRLIKNAFVIV